MLGRLLVDLGLGMEYVRTLLEEKYNRRSTLHLLTTMSAIIIRSLVLYRMLHQQQRLNQVTNLPARFPEP